MRVPVKELMLAVVIAATALAQAPAFPYLYITHTTSDGKQVEATSQPIQFSNHERLNLRVCLRTRAVGDPIEQLEIQAVNQHPDYFRQRAGPNVTLKVIQIAAQPQEGISCRVNSSGGGKSLTVHYVNAEIDLLEDRAVRRQRAQGFVEWIAAEARRQGAKSQALSIMNGDPRQMQAMVDQMENQYVNNPAGDYEIVAHYQPVSRGRHWTGTLVSRPFRVRVVPGPDFFDRAREKMGGGGSVTR